MTHENGSEETIVAVRTSNGDVLFICGVPASRSNAIGVQILQFAIPFGAAWKHCYWNTEYGESDASNSHCLSPYIPRRWPFVTGRGFLTRQVDRLGLGWWRADRLLGSRKPQLRRMLQNVRFAYAAPIHNSDATKCREILETVGCPFVVHLWDFLDAALNADYAWLFSRAEHVFCVSRSVENVVQKSATCETSLLRFVRRPSNYRAKYCGAGTLVVGVVGTLSTYKGGIDLLDRAVDDLQRQFGYVRVKYLGWPNEFNFVPKSLKGLTEYVGFPDDEKRDKALADCNVAYLPGPLLPPEQDLRSKYSIPSRIADYLAVGLPVIAAANIDSATSILLSPLQYRGFFPVSEPEDVLQAAEKLRTEEAWTSASHECLAFFDAHFENERGLNEFCRVARRFL
jgi:glycosyltransferase involved in cell wall biosynthesis